MTLTMATRLQRNEGLLATELEGEIVLMSIERGSYYGVEKSARRIWELLSEPLTVQQLCTLLESEYRIDSETCRRDVLPFLEQLQQEGLIVVARD